MRFLCILGEDFNEYSKEIEAVTGDEAAKIATALWFPKMETGHYVDLTVYSIKNGPYKFRVSQVCGLSTQLMSNK